MNTPLYDFLLKYSSSEILRCHMPGHKGKFRYLENICNIDITEIKGADSLFEADGIILQSEKNMSDLYGTAASFYSAGGSTLCIQAMLAAMKFENRKIIAVRNVHRAFLNAAALLDIDVIWLMPKYDGGILSGEINIDDAENLLKKYPSSCLYVTSPDYTGKTADIKKLSEICHKYNSVLLVDNAHGAHLHFFEKSMHPIYLGADICCDSAHKMLPALTGAAVLHTSSEKYAKILRQCMSIFASTSPSYLIMASLDLCNKYISKNIRNDIKNNLRFIKDFRNNFPDMKFADGEPFHITLKASESGYNGNKIAELMRINGVECEYSDDDIIIFLMSPINCREDYGKLSDSLRKVLTSVKKHEIISPEFFAHLPKKAMSVRQAVFSESEEITVENSLGRICASVKVPCPPAVPIAASGEIIDETCINIFKRYGISSVIVVK
ncbi:MAG: aminotransferase class I/II-fold pyridoxal phosphate-dependent enzyme [Ruminococcus sp.]|nr:aminotransferase class I/II-fold pyridoxal phosphate-dependent enzyme [Ruminococcus sp.]